MTLFSKAYTLDGKPITLTEWTNEDDLLCVKKAMLSVPRNSPIRNEEVNGLVQVWRLAMALEKGDGYLKGKRLDETYNNIQKLGVKLGNQLSEFFIDFMEEIGLLKKKLEQPSGPVTTPTKESTS